MSVKRIIVLVIMIGAALMGALLTQRPAAAGDNTPPPDVTLFPLLFRRDAPPEGATATILSVGDTSFGRGLQPFAAERGMDDLLAPTAPLIRSADLAIGNFEGVIAAEGVGEKQPGAYRLRSETGAAAALARAGFDLFSLANNHSLDFGPGGLKSTIEHFKQAKIKTFGAGTTQENAYAPVVTEVNGIKVVWLGYTMVNDPYRTYRDWDGEGIRAWINIYDDYTKIIPQIKAARALGDVLIVQIHWGHEYVTCPSDWQVRVAHAAVDAGASLVVGHHPHVIQDIEVYNGVFIAYSLGNYLFDQETRPGLGLWARVDKQGVVDIHGLGLKSGFLPEWDEPARTAANLRNTCRPQPGASALFGYNPDGFSRLEETAPEPSRFYCPEDNTPFEVGYVDLKGDGVPERIVIRDQRLSVYEDGRETYRTIPLWKVVDAALGDPNQDGRFEVIMLVWKQDEPNLPMTTHPFVLGWRRGKYQVIWGGSATLKPLQALTVGDLDGDRLDELITLEREPGALPCDPSVRVVVLGWNGWGFTQRWQSEPGAFGAVDVINRAGKPAILAQSC